MSGLSTKHVVLGLLIERSGYGYDLRHRLQSQFDFLNLSENAVYGILDRLEKEGSIEQTSDRPVNRTRRGAPRVRYRVTPVGRQRFKKWISTPSPRPLLRDDLQGKLRIAGPDDLPDLLRIAETQHRECLAELAALQRPVLAQVGDPNVPWEAASTIMLDAFHMGWLQWLVDWLDAICEVIEERIQRADEATSR